jgi:hypothetical protein
MLTTDQFIEKFPEFDERIDEDVITEIISQISLETDGYEGLSTSEKQSQALALHTAYVLELAYPVNQALTGNLKRLKSLNDEVEYAISNIDPSSLESNKYGQRLKRFLDSQFMGGLYV